MSRWFRHYAGMMRDDKLVRASLRCKQSIERVVWVYGAVLESAAEHDEEGRYEVDVAEIAYFLRCKPAAIEAVLAALQELGRIDGERVTAWSKRQFKSDRSNDRVATHRANRKQSGNVTGNVTSAIPKRDGNSPETETETEYSVAKATGAAAPDPDPEKTFWADAKAYLGPRMSGDPGAYINRMLRQRGKQLTMAALNAAQLERAVDPPAYLEGYFRRHGQNGQPQPVVPL